MFTVEASAGRPDFYVAMFRFSSLAPLLAVAPPVIQWISFDRKPRPNNCQSSRRDQVPVPDLVRRRPAGDQAAPTGPREFHFHLVVGCAYDKSLCWADEIVFCVNGTPAAVGSFLLRLERGVEADEFASGSPPI